MARRLIEHGSRYVTVNHFDTVFNLSCWDMHADGGGLNNTYARLTNASVPAIRPGLYGADRGPGAARLAQGNGGGGAQRVWAHAERQWPRRPRPLSARLDELPVRRQHSRRQVIGSTDKNGAAPHDYPIKPPQVIATIYAGMGIDLETTMMPGPGGRPIRFVEAQPIPELIG